MAFQHVYGWSYRTTGTLNGSVVLTGDAEENYSFEVPAAISGTPGVKQMPVSIAVASLQGIIIDSDTDVVIKTNTTDGSTGIQETISLTTLPLIWCAGYFDVPFAGNLTNLYVENYTAAVANVDVRSIEQE